MTINVPAQEIPTTPRSGWRRFAPGGKAGAVIAALILAGTISGLLLIRPASDQLEKPVDVPVRIAPAATTSEPAVEPADLATLAGLADIAVRGTGQPDGKFRVTHVLVNHIGSSVATITLQLPEAVPPGSEEILFLSAADSPNSRTYNADERLFGLTSATAGRWRVEDNRVSPPGPAWDNWQIKDFTNAVKDAPNPRDAASRLLRKYGFSPAQPDRVDYQLAGGQCPPGTAEEAASHDIGLHPGDATGPGVVRVSWLPSARGEQDVSAYVLVSGTKPVAAWLVADKTGKVYSLKQRLEATQAAR